MAKTILLTVSSLFHPTYSRIRAKVISLTNRRVEISSKQAKKLNRELCGISGCHCGGYERAIFEDKEGNRWNYIVD